MPVQISIKRLQEIEKELEELREFKKRIELGSYWLKCLLYTIGGIAAFVATVVTIVKDWPFR